MNALHGKYLTPFILVIYSADVFVLWNSEAEVGGSDAPFILQQTTFYGENVDFVN